MANTVTITLPIPDRRLSPNTPRNNWRYKAVLVKSHRDMAILSTWEQAGRGLPKWAKVSILVRWFGKTAACLRMDQTNIIGTLKPYEDGISDAGLIKNDVGVTWLPPERAVCKANPRVEMVITKLESP